jgi:hypothetical protein
MPQIFFTSDARPVSDFDAEGFVKDAMYDLSVGDDVAICNVLVFNMLRAALLNDDFKNQIEWWYDDGTGAKKIDMDKNMRCKNFWYVRVASLGEVALDTLLFT